MQELENINDRILKTRYPFFQDVWDNLKTAEIRKLDRDFKVNQHWFLDDYFLIYPGNGRYGNKRIHIVITHIMTYEEYPEGLKENYGMISFKKIRNIVLERF